MAGKSPQGWPPGSARGQSGGQHARGRRWEAFARAVIQRHGGLCHLCGHGGARSVDHVIAVAERPELEWELSNCRPAHNAPHNRCPVCGLGCNQIRGALSIERAKRIIAERIAENAPPRGRPEPDTQAGRPW